VGGAAAFVYMWRKGYVTQADLTGALGSMASGIELVKGNVEKFKTQMAQLVGGVSDQVEKVRDSQADMQEEMGEISDAVDDLKVDVRRVHDAVNDCEERLLDVQHSQDRSLKGLTLLCSTLMDLVPHESARKQLEAFVRSAPACLPPAMNHTGSKAGRQRTIQSGQASGNSRRLAIEPQQTSPRASTKRRGVFTPSSERRMHRSKHRESGRRTPTSSARPHAGSSQSARLSGRSRPQTRWTVDRPAFERAPLNQGTQDDGYGFDSDDNHVISDDLHGDVADGPSRFEFA